MMVLNQKVKALLFTLILAFIAIGTVAIAAVMKNEKPVEVERVMVMETWEFTGSDPLDATHYTLVGSTPPNCPGLPETICTIQAPEDASNAGYPDLNAEVTLPNSEIVPVNKRIEQALTIKQNNETVLSLKEE